MVGKPLVRPVVTVRPCVKKLKAPPSGVLGGQYENLLALCAAGPGAANRYQQYGRHLGWLTKSSQYKKYLSGTW